MEASSTNTTKEETPLSQRYKNLATIGNGTFGIVYMAQDTMSLQKQKVAVKHVHQNKRFKNRQLEILLQIQHQNIVKLLNHYYSEKKDSLYLNLVMEYVPKTLSSIIKDHIYSKTFIENEHITKYAYGLIKALAYLEEKNIAHRDIKPSNILISDDHQAKLCDFGSAKILVQGQKNIAYICSRYYRSPELIFGAIFYGTKTDVWSVGCCIAEMMINRPLFDGSNNSFLLIKIIKVLGSPTEQDLKAMKVDKEQIQKTQGTGLKERLLNYNPTVDAKLIDLIQRMIVYNPQNRIRPVDALKLPMFQDLVKQDQHKGI